MVTLSSFRKGWSGGRGSVSNTSTAAPRMVRSLRAVPLYAEISAGVARYCPDAWVISYTNPMSVCVRTLYRVFPQVKAFGCCHEVFGTQSWLARLLDEYHGLRLMRDQIREFPWLTHQDSPVYNPTTLFKIFVIKRSLLVYVIR